MSVDSALTRTGAIIINPDHFLARKRAQLQPPALSALRLDICEKAIPVIADVHRLRSEPPPLTSKMCMVQKSDHFTRVSQSRTALTGHWSGANLPRFSFRIPAVRAPRSILTMAMTATRDKAAAQPNNPTKLQSNGYARCKRSDNPRLTETMRLLTIYVASANTGYFAIDGMERFSKTVATPPNTIMCKM